MPLLTDLPFRLILATVLLTSKFYNDIFFANHHIAYIGGVPTEELNRLEQYYLEVIDWQLFVSPEEYARYDQALIDHVHDLLKSGLHQEL